MEGNKRSPSKLLTRILLVFIALVLLDQVRFLFVYPVPDTGMWFGDETWTMLTLREFARSGIARVPEAIGSSLAHSNGLINGSVWISGVLYGMPARILASTLSPVAIGRIITFVLSLVSLWVVNRLSRKLNASPFTASLSVFALVLCDAFYFSSHSARLDMATGLAILLFFQFIVSAFDAPPDRKNIFAFLIPFVNVFLIAVYVHIPALIALPALFTLWRIGGFKKLYRVLLMIAGVMVGGIIIVATYWLSTGSISLLGYGYNQYYNVANSLPVLHLLSWRVQKINTIDRAFQVWDVAWPIVLALAFGIIAHIRVKQRVSERERFFLINALLLILSWALFGGPAVFYNIYVLPVAAISAAILFGPALNMNTFAGWRYVLWIAILILLTGHTIFRQERLGTVGQRLKRQNEEAIHGLTDSVALRTSTPIVLTDEPAINAIAADPNVRLMTNHLLLFGFEDRPLDQILKEHHVRYLLLYSTVRWQSPFRPLADSLYTLIGERTGTLTDQARTYDNPNWNEIDTVRLYTIK